MAETFNKILFTALNLAKESSQNINCNWGLKPVLFEVNGFQVPSYSIMMLTAILAGLAIYLYQLKKDGIKNSNAGYIALFALTFGAIGAKIPLVAIYWDEIAWNPNALSVVLSGRTILGGLIGGAIGTFAAKKLFKIRERMGNQLAIPVAVGMAIGRLGCLMAGCCYGIQTSLFWGIDFGDHIHRHPTQIYEIIFDLSLAAYLVYRKKKSVEDGELFSVFLNNYLIFRFFLEFIRVEKISMFIFTDFQILCCISLIYINRKKIVSFLKSPSFNRKV